MKGKKKSGIIAVFLFFGLFIIVGIGLIVYGLKNKSEMNAKDGYYIETTGWIIDYAKSSDSDGDYTYASIVEYEVDGEYYTVVQDVYSSQKEPMDKRHTVMYHPQNPSDAYIKSGLRTYWFLIFAGIFFAAVPSVALFGMICKNQDIVLILFMILFEVVGVGFLYLSYASSGTINPFRSPSCLVGYFFTFLPILIFATLIWNAIQMKNNDKIWTAEDSPVRSEATFNGNGIRAVVREITPLWDDEKEILFSREDGEEEYYTYTTISSGYFEVGKTFLIRVENIEEKVAPSYRDGRKIYDLSQLGLTITRFVGLNEPKTVIDKAEDFYADNKEEIDAALDKAIPVVKKVGAGISLVQKIATSIVLLIFVAAGVWVVYSTWGDAGWARGFILSMGMWFVFLPLGVIAQMFFDKSGVIKAVFPFVALFIGGGVVVSYFAYSGQSYHPVQNPWTLIGYAVMAAAVILGVRKAVRRVSEYKREKAGGILGE